MMVKSEKNDLDDQSVHSVEHADNVRLAELGYKAEFKREFSVW